MLAVVQRVDRAGVFVENNVVSQIDKGLLVLVALEKTDTEFDINFMIKKIINLRIFEDDNGKFNLSVKDVKGKILSVSQFTLTGDVTKGNRPSFNDAMEIDKAKEFYSLFFKKLKSKYKEVYDGKFQAKMLIELVNNGPVTIIIDSKKKRKR